MEFTILLFLVMIIPTLIWLGVSTLRRHRRNESNRPGSTDGGSPTIYRRAPRPDATDVPA